MKTFNKAFKVGTKVRFPGESVFWEVLDVHETRKWISIKGLMGSFPRGDIEEYSNRPDVPTAYIHITPKERQLALLFSDTSVDTCGEFNEHNNMSYLNAEDISDALGWDMGRVGGVVSRLLAKGLITDTAESGRIAHLNDFSANPSVYLTLKDLKHAVTKEQ